MFKFIQEYADMVEVLYKEKIITTKEYNACYGSDILPFLIDIFSMVKDGPERIKQYYSKEIEEYYLDPE